MGEKLPKNFIRNLKVEKRDGKYFLASNIDWSELKDLEELEDPTKRKNAELEAFCDG